MRTYRRKLATTTYKALEKTLETLDKHFSDWRIVDMISNGGSGSNCEISIVLEKDD